MLTTFGPFKGEGTFANVIPSEARNLGWGTNAVVTATRVR